VSAKAWIEWKEKCAAELCTEATQGYLYEFGKTRFYSICRKRWEGVIKIELSDAQSAAWGLLESHAMLPRTGAWKRYKDRMLEIARADDFQDDLEGYAFTMLKTAIMELAKKELPSWNSLDRPIGDGSSGATRIDFLLDAEDGPSEAMYEQEISAIAADMAKGIELESSEALILAATGLDLGLNNEKVLSALKLPKATVYDHRKRLVERIANVVLSDLSGQDDDDETRRDVTTAILYQLRTRTLSKFISEKLHPELFKESEGSDPS